MTVYQSEGFLSYIWVELQKSRDFRLDINMEFFLHFNICRQNITRLKNLITKKNLQVISIPFCEQLSIAAILDLI